MNDENDKPKSDDWGMTMPHLRLETNKNADDVSDDFVSNSSSANQSPKTDWQVTPQDLNPQNSQPSSSDFDKTSPNINTPSDVWQDKPLSNPHQSSRDDWGMTVPNVNLTKQEKQDDWSMPAPVFRISEGEKVNNLPKRTINFNLNEADDYDKTTPNFNLSELSPPYPYGAPPTKLALQPPNISAPISANQSVAVTPTTEKATSSKLIYALGGLIATLFFAIVALALVYFLFLRKPEVPQKVETPKEESKQTGAVVAAENILEWVDASFEPYLKGNLTIGEVSEKNRIASGGHFG
jgi:hypothetical protein